MDDKVLIDIVRGLQRTIHLLERYVYNHDVDALPKASSTLATSGKMLHRLSVATLTLRKADSLAKGIV